MRQDLKNLSGKLNVFLIQERNLFGKVNAFHSLAYLLAYMLQLFNFREQLHYRFLKIQVIQCIHKFKSSEFQ